ncbi:MAG TPA: NAD-dependent epimerase/dehydratase family protein [Polyangiaceae bacterium]|nr:NAD-dependent epimerase/dehydratase family protein [Polyangiaceae bacterium]
MMPPVSVRGLDGAVVVTGACGRLGRRLARALHRQCRVIGLDRRPFPDRPRDVEHHELDLRSARARDVFASGVSAVVHLGVDHDLRANSADNHAINMTRMQKLFEYVEHFGIKKVVLLSSANVYGPRPDNPQFLTEDAPLLGAGPFSQIRDLVELDMGSQAYFWRLPEVATVILRPAHILGTVKNAPSNYLRLAVVPTLLGFDPMMQAVHQDDVVRAIMLALKPTARGIFNIAGPPPVPLSRVLELLERATVGVPHTMARLGVERLFKLRVTSFPAPELDFIRYVCMIDDARARRDLGYAPAHGLVSTLCAVDEERWLG